MHNSITSYLIEYSFSIPCEKYDVNFSISFIHLTRRFLIDSDFHFLVSLYPTYSLSFVVRFWSIDWNLSHNIVSWRPNGWLCSLGMIATQNIIVENSALHFWDIRISVWLKTHWNSWTWQLKLFLLCIQYVMNTLHYWRMVYCICLSYLSRTRRSSEISWYHELLLCYSTIWYTFWYARLTLWSPAQWFS